MGKKDKLIKRLRSNPKDFSIDEADTLLSYYGYVRSDKGRTSGSRISYTSPEHGDIFLHRPHPGRELRTYQVKQILAHLEQEGLL